VRSAGLCAFAGAGTVVWLLVMLVDSYLASGLRGGLAETALIVDVGLRQSAWVISGCAGLVLLDRLLWRRSWLVRSLATIALLPVCVDQALFLTAGDGISGHAYVTVIRIAIGALLLVLSAALIEWLRFALAGSARTRRAQVVWLGLGWAMFAGLATIVRHRLEFYAHFAAFLLFVVASALRWPGGGMRGVRPWQGGSWPARCCW
jgi:hypothetical protein